MASARPLEQKQLFSEVKYTINTGVEAALTDKTHPKFGKRFRKEIRINQKWSLEKDFLHAHALFLQVS